MPNAPTKQLDQIWDNLALTNARLWAEAEMEKIDHHALVATLTRDEYQELLIIVFSMGFRSGVKAHRGR